MKMFAPGFPPRRPGGLIRYILVAGIIVWALYFFGSDSRKLSPPIEFSKPVPQGPDTKPVTADTPPPAIPPVAERPPANPPASNPPASNPKADTPSRPPTKPKAGGSDQTPDTQRGKPASGAPPKSDHANHLQPDKSKEETSTTGPDDVHPIAKLIYDAEHNFAELTSKESKTLEEAAQQYRRRRGRHPPPGFDKWFEFAQNNSAIIVEDFFDQVYHDLEPFWGVDPAVIRKESVDFEMTIHVRDGVATTGSDWFWTEIWLNLTKTIEHLLPDMDLALNAMDEPRIVTPWEDIEAYMHKASQTKGLSPASNVVRKFKKLPAPRDVEPGVKTRPKNFEGTAPFWDIVRRGCAPDSGARKTPLQPSFDKPPKIDATNAKSHSYKGFVSNYTLSTDLCHQPDLQGLEGILIAPLSTKSTKTFFPMFGGSKLSVNNEILLPAPMYWNEEERFTGGDDHGIAWNEKKNGAIWRGVATGGRNNADNWRGFQRHRFVSMSNGTQVSLVESGEAVPQNFALPDEHYGLKAQEDGKLGKWVNEWADVAFIELSCTPEKQKLEETMQGDQYCDYVRPYFKTEKGLKMAEQFDHKILPDIDGNSFSGRYLGFLRSTSLPLKSTIWREWHDSRLVAWKHFVPMDNRFGDYYGLMEYFLGYGGRKGHDQAAEKIATEGKQWAEQVLRKEDMQIYVLRLLLEYARLLDDQRETMGWVDDALKDPSITTIWKSWW